MTKLTILLALLAASTTACIDQPDDGSASDDDAVLVQRTSVAPTSGDNCGEDDGGDASTADGIAGRSARPEAAALDPEQCELLPADGPCSLACTPDLLVETYVPAGTCMIVHCVLSDGETFNTGGCNLR